MLMYLSYHAIVTRMNMNFGTISPFACCLRMSTENFEIWMKLFDFKWIFDLNRILSSTRPNDKEN